MSIAKEFREFAVKGNVADMAIGIVIGAAFGKIVSSVVADVIMPPLGLIVGGVNFTGLKLTLKEAVAEQAAVTLNYGSFLQAIFDFTIVAFAMFMIVKAMNRMRKAQEAAPTVTPTETLLGEIRDLLKSGR